MLESTWRDSQPWQLNSGIGVDARAMRRYGGSRVRGIGKWRGGVMQRGGTTTPGAFKGVLAERNVSRSWAGKRREGEVDWAAQPLLHNLSGKQRERGRKRWCARDRATRKAAEQGATKPQRPNKRWRIPIHNKKPPRMTPKRTRVHPLGPDGMTGPTITAQASPNTNCPEVCWQQDGPCGGLVAA